MKTEAQVWARCQQIGAMAPRGELWDKRRRSLVRWIEGRLDDHADPSETWREIDRCLDALHAGQAPQPGSGLGREVAVVLPAEVKAQIAEVLVVAEEIDDDPEPDPEPTPDPKPVRLKTGDRVRVGDDVGEVLETKRDKVRVMRDGYQRARWFPKAEVKPA